MKDKLVQSESGAALILVLFVVVLLASVGSAMLFSTSYSKQTIVSNAEVQGEFYRAEGAIEVALKEMEIYEKGAIAYLQEELPKQFSIGAKNDIPIKVSLESYDKETNTYEIGARYASESKVNRNLLLNIQEETIVSGYLKSPLYFVENFNYNGSNNHDTLKLYDNKLKMSNTDFNTVKAHLEIPNDASNFGHEKVSSSKNYMSGTHFFEVLDYSGNDNQLYIGPDAIVMVKEMKVTGQGNTSNIVVDGVLIVNDLNHGGNFPITVNGALVVTSNYNGAGKLIINSGIIVKNFSTSGNNDFTGEGKGIDCSLIGLANAGLCKKGSSEDVTNTSTIKVEDYKTTIGNK
ncbi:hypothetical protein [Halalkalibacter krulwichiae]|uniref:Uncharacterized protein n=1 Tax=Halalkalibacter krulwichiae TaxID=199441 RepID=A0A1X9MHK4_9BACI|nr:hypothetical protein [Halalkalibacter krulwichiae]ARK31603.1 hypothetical protein BkAM31D_18095 [Halalkalibacter krulwichiae]